MLGIFDEDSFCNDGSYYAWANARLFRMAGTLADELYRKEVGAYFKSLHGTLNHLLVADRIWMRRLTCSGDHPDKLNAMLFDDDLSSLISISVQRSPLKSIRGDW
jgi:uncharacterized damage-inducible protein DinB